MDDHSKKLFQLAVRLGAVLEERKFSLVAAESCTGGWLSHVLTSVPKSSSWFERGLVTYSDDSKKSLLQVKQATLDEYGAVSREVAKEMAEGALANSNAQVSIAITGAAGPKGTEEAPVGTCWIAWSSKQFDTEVEKKFFEGDRININYQAIEFALTHLLAIINRT